MEFTSQICTTEEQSKRLLSLGLKRETADCVMMYYDGWHVGEAAHFDFDKDHVEPAWSLHRLLCLLPTEYIADMDFQRIMQDFIFRSQNMYDEVISCIETLIKEGYFYEEYLTQ